MMRARQRAVMMIKRQPVRFFQCKHALYNTPAAPPAFFLMLPALFATPPAIVATTSAPLPAAAKCRGTAPRCRKSAAKDAARQTMQQPLMAASFYEPRA